MGPKKKKARKRLSPEMAPNTAVNRDQNRASPGKRTSSQKSSPGRKKVVPQSRNGARKGEPLDSPVKAKRPACATCKARKVRCEYKDGTDKCVKCAKSGISCAPPLNLRSVARKGAPGLVAQNLVSTTESSSNWEPGGKHFSQGELSAPPPFSGPTIFNPAYVSSTPIAKITQPTDVFIPPGPRGEDDEGEDEEDEGEDEGEDEEDEEDAGPPSQKAEATLKLISTSCDDASDEELEVVQPQAPAEAPQGIPDIGDDDRWLQYSAGSWELEALAEMEKERIQNDSDVELIDADDSRYKPSASEEVRESSSEEEMEDGGDASSDQSLMEWKPSKGGHSQTRSRTPTRKAVWLPTGATQRKPSVPPLAKPDAKQKKRGRKDSTTTSEPAKKKRARATKADVAETFESRSESEDEEVDPYLTAVFDYSAMYFDPSGKRPFTVSSSLSLPALLDIVAQKLQNHPANIKLRYRLDSESSKDRIMIGNDEELKHFIERIRPYFVRQLTATGKPSGRRMKPVHVIFDDANKEDPVPQTSKKSGAKEPSKKQIQANLAIGGYEEKVDETLAKLRDKLHCGPHSKDGPPKYCFKRTVRGVVLHHPIVLNQIRAWANSIAIDGTSNNDEKLPEHLAAVLNETRRDKVHERQGNQPPQDFAPGPAPMQPGYPAPPFGYPHYYGNAPPLFQQPYQHQFFQGMTQPPPPQMVPLPQGGALLSNVSFPKIDVWLAYLDLQPERARSDFKFSSLHEEFTKHQFQSLNELILDPSILSPKEFASLLGLGGGIVFPLLQYAKEDVAAIRAGQLTIPATDNVAM